MPDHTYRALRLAAFIHDAQLQIDHAIAEAFLAGWEGVHDDLGDITLELERVRQSLITRPNARSHRRARADR
jgi:hypothetical protein